MKIIFDLDGTLFQAGSVAIPAFKTVLQQLQQPIPDDSVLLNTLGYPITEIWQMLLPDRSIEEHQRAIALMDEAEAKLIRAGQGQLFPEVKATLEKLVNQGHQLYTLSNCQEPYLLTVTAAFQLQDLFTALYCAGMFPGETKVQILERILAGDKHAVMVGDRFHDIEAGKLNNIPTVWCNYGFSQSSEIIDPDYTIDEFNKLLAIVASLC